MRKLLLASVAAVGLAFTATGAQAALLTINNGNAFSTPASNDFSGAGWAGRINGPVGMLGSTPMTVVTTAANVQLTFTYLFRESSNTANSFNTPFGSFTTGQCPNAAACGPGFPTFSGNQAAAGALNFNFITQNNPGNPNNNGEAAEVAPGNNIYGFFATINAPNSPGEGNAVPSGSTADTIWLAFDDSGAGPDDNHDDMIIRIDARVREVPEPASLALLGAGLLGLGFAARRRRNV